MRHVRKESCWRWTIERQMFEAATPECSKLISMLLPCRWLWVRRSRQCCCCRGPDAFYTNLSALQLPDGRREKLTAGPVTVWNHCSNTLWQTPIRPEITLTACLCCCFWHQDSKHVNFQENMFTCYLISQVLWWGDHQCNLYKLTDWDHLGHLSLVIMVRPVSH